MSVDISRMSELCTVLGTCGYVIRAAVKAVKLVGKLEDMLGNFPMHRHVNGHILYPDGYEPPPIGEMSIGKGAGAD